MIFNVFVYKRRRNSYTSYIVYFGNNNNYRYRITHDYCPTKKVTYRMLNNICAKTTHFTCIGQSKFENASFTFTLVQCYRVEE